MFKAGKIINKMATVVARISLSRIYILCLVELFSQYVYSSDINVHVQAAENGVDWDAVIASLKNANESPQIVNRSAYIPANYNWKEQERVLDVTRKLIIGMPEAWPACVRRFDDKEYCLTMRYEVNAINKSIGDICQILLLESVTAAYMPHIPDGEGAFLRLQWPDPIPEDRFSEWAQDQIVAKKSLYALQIEMCEWAAGVIVSEKISGVTQEAREKSGNLIRMQAVKLRERKRPVLMKSIAGELREIYTPELAKRVRARIDSMKNK